MNILNSSKRLVCALSLASLALAGYAQESEEMPKYTISPADGSEVYEISYVELSFDASSASIADPDMIFLEDANGSPIEFFANVSSFGLEPALLIQPLEPITNPGVYRLIIGYGALKVDGSLLPEPITASWTVLPAADSWDGEIIIDPADGSTLESIHSVLFTFVGANKVIIDESAGPSSFPFLLNKNNDSTEKAMVLAKDNTLEVILLSYVETPGEYVLTVPKDLLKIDGAPLAANITAEYTIGGSMASYDYTYSFNPADGSTIACQEEITVSFAGEALEKIECNPYASSLDGSLPSFTAADGSSVPCLINDGNDDLSFVVSPYYPIEEPGQYTLKIPAGYVTLYNKDGVQEKNTAFSATYQVVLTGIDAIATDMRDSEIYNLDGTKAQLPLSNGIYIINGKQTLIRK